MGSEPQTAGLLGMRANQLAKGLPFNTIQAFYFCEFPTCFRIWTGSTKSLNRSCRSSTSTMASLHSTRQCSFQRASRFSMMSVTNATPTSLTPPRKIPTPFAALRSHKRWPRQQTFCFLFQPNSETDRFETILFLFFLLFSIEI